MLQQLSMTENLQWVFKIHVTIRNVDFEIHTFSKSSLNKKSKDKHKFCF